MRIGAHLRHNRRHVLGEGRHIGAHVLQREQDAVVLQRVMGGAHHAVPVTAAVADKLDVEVVQTDVVADLLERPAIDEGRDTIGPALLAHAGGARRDRDHVLFGDAGVDEAPAHGGLQGLKRHEAEIAGEEDERLAGVQLHQAVAECGSHLGRSSLSA